MTTASDSLKKDDPEQHSLEFFRSKYIEALEGRVGLHEEISAREAEIRERDQTIRALRAKVAELEEALENGASVAMSIDTVEQAPPVVATAKTKASRSSSSGASTKKSSVKPTPAPVQKASPTRAASKSRRVSAVSEKVASSSSAVADTEKQTASK